MTFVPADTIDEVIEAAFPRRQGAGVFLGGPRVDTSPATTRRKDERTNGEGNGQGGRRGRLRPPYVERLAQDEELHDHVKNAYESARKIYDDLLGDRGTTGMAFKVARDKDIQKELSKAVEELRKAGERAQGKESHTGRNVDAADGGHRARRPVQPGDRAPTRAAGSRTSCSGPSSPSSPYENQSERERQSELSPVS